MSTLPLHLEIEVARFAIPGEPMSKARARFTGYGSKVRTYTPAKTLAGEAKVRAAYLKVAKPSVDKDEAFGVAVEFLHSTGQRRDVDNMLKLVLDGLNKVAWPDDVQVIRVSATKRRVPPGKAETRVTVYSLGRIDKPRGECIRCGAEFAQYASTSKRKFCTRECHFAWRRERRERPCEHCGTVFEAHHPDGDQRYCSAECHNKARHVEVACVQCGTAFTKPRSLNRTGNAYCSPECKATYWRLQRKSAAKGTCQDCGGPTTKKTYKRCRDCAIAAGGAFANKERCPECDRHLPNRGDHRCRADKE